MPRYELYGTRPCPYTKEVREWLQLRSAEFVEHDVETDRVALERLLQISNGQPLVPVLVADGRVVQIGWQGRTCRVDVGQP